MHSPRDSETTRQVPTAGDRMDVDPESVRLWDPLERARADDDPGALAAAEDGVFRFTSRWPTRLAGSGCPARWRRSMSYARPRSVSPRPFWPVGNQAAAGSRRSPVRSSPLSSGALLPPAASTGRNHEADESTPGAPCPRSGDTTTRPSPRSPGRGACHRARGIHPRGVCRGE